MADHRRLQLRDDLAMPRQPREAMLRGELCQRRGRFRVERARAAHVHVEAVVGRGELDVQRLVCRGKRLGDRFGCSQRAVEFRGEDRAAVDRHDVA